MSLLRIDKIISSQNIASRSEVKSLIKKGKIIVDGKTVKSPDQKFDPDISVIQVDGETVLFKKYVYIMMNKPAGILSASNDKNAKTVIDLLPSDMRRRGLFPAGRLDKDTEGFILITDDGDLAHKMLSPKSHVYKLYEAVVDRNLNDNDLNAFQGGIQYGDLQFLPANMKIIAPNRALVEICEGKFHQVKKMFNALGANVTYLKRLRIGNLFLDNSLQSGQFRELSDNEIADLLSRKKGF